ncbi:MAG: hypothetical protein O3C64_06005 [Proteobacteria bacterium]|nr:hypothetical protein [Pseudomonadota bacterium]
MPFYEEDENFEALIKKIEEIEETEEIFTIVDNGSSSNRIQDYYYKNNPNKEKWTFLKIQNNIGFGGAVKHTATFVNEDFIAWMPGNNKVDPTDLLELIKDPENLQENLLVKAKRSQRPLIASFKTFIFSILFSIWFQKLMFDNGGTPNIISKNILLNISNSPNDFLFDVFIYYYSIVNGYNTKRPKVAYKKRLYGESHWQKGFKSEFKLLWDVFSSKKIWRNIAQNDMKKKKT